MYFVHDRDNSGGAIIGDRSVYYHHYKIENYSKYYDVFAYTVSNSAEIQEKLQQLAKFHPDRKIQLVNLVGHGDPKSMGSSESPEDTLLAGDAEHQAIFGAVDKEGAIILDGCSTGEGQDSLAEKIAGAVRGVTVYAPDEALFWSKPLMDQEGAVRGVVHGLGKVYAAVMRRFQATDARKFLYNRDQF